MISQDDLRNTLLDIDEYQSFRESFNNEDRVLRDGINLAEETQRLQDILEDREVSHAVQIYNGSDQNPSNRIYAPQLSDSYEKRRGETDIKIVGSSEMHAILRYVADRVREDFVPIEECFVIPRYFYLDRDDYT